MEDFDIDGLSRVMAATDSRRGLARLLAALPLVAALLALVTPDSEAKDRRKRTKGRHDRRQNRRGKQKARGRKHKETDRRRKQNAKQRKRRRQRQRQRDPACVPDPPAVTCANRCASVTNNCGQAVDCGPCDCGVCAQCTSCNPATGECDPAFEDQPCSDGNECTQTDTCQAGVCVGSNPVVCTALDDCHDVGVCDPGTGTCSNPEKPNDTPCDVDNLCTPGKACQSGVCTGGTSVSCPVCQMCDASSGQCVAAFQGQACGSPGQVCHDGVCTCTATSCPACLKCDANTGQCVADPAQNRTVCAGDAPNTSVCCNGVCCDGCCDGNGACGACRVFLTGQPQFNGNLGGVSGADEICRARAQGVGLPGATIVGNYKAWLSDSTGNAPATRFRRSQQPYVLPDASSTQVADDWADLTTCDDSGQCLDHAIDVFETGTATSGAMLVWTHTTPAGMAEAGNDHCVNWTSGEFSPHGNGGRSDQVAAFWTTGSNPRCNTPIGRLYCFQQT